ncbi:hypothetical protein [Litorihabitans aurantiacus]|uniref:hypothetical protein n=1 Tax=Litorihabitans aurantiacus TaxID=1930061 RepID=UPI0024E0D063|nr:hypothetical protein [Litorihabitans aurantiacus]
MKFFPRLLALSVLPLPLMACGVDADTAEPSIDPVDPAATAEGGDEDTFADRLGRSLNAERTFEFEVEMTSPGTNPVQLMNGRVDSSTEPVELDVSLDDSGDPTKPTVTRSVDGVVYFGVGDSRGKYYIIDPAEGSPWGSADELLAAADPLNLWSDALTAITRARYLGIENVDGMDLGRYSATFDLRQILPDEDLGTLPAFYEINADFWFDEDNHLRIVERDLWGDLEVTTLHSWGAAFEIVPPGADELLLAHW